MSSQPSKRIESRNQEIEDILDRSLEKMRMILDGPKSDEMPESERIKAQRIIEGSGTQEPIFKEMVQRQGDQVPEIEAQNYIDHWKSVNNQLDTEPDSKGLYLMAGEDWTPALEIDGEWTYLGLGYDQGSVEIDGEEISLVNHDISEGLPFDQEFDYAVVKSPGAGNIDGKLGETGVNQAYQALKEDGVLITDQDYDGKFRPEGVVDPSPLAFLRKVSTDHGSAYNTDQLRILSK
ncbi:MAG: hypothetical protein V5A72_00965 [Candidatus Nanohaloarchaea archaeon]